MAPSEPTKSGEFLWSEEGQTQIGPVAEIAPLLPVEHTYSFAIPPDLADVLKVGHRVRVPVGRRGRLVSGFVVRIDRRPWEDTLRPIHSVLDPTTFLTPDLVRLGRSVAEHYVCPLGRTLKAMTPEAVRRGRGMFVVRTTRLARPIEDILAEAGRLGPKRRALLDGLHSAGGAMEVTALLERSGASRAVWRSLVSLGYLTVETTRAIEAGAGSMSVNPEPGKTGTVDRDPVPLEEPSYELHEGQSAALAQVLDRIRAGGFSCTLLYGVSGSGKTEVYVRAMREVVCAGGQAILLIPEIVLTTQLVQRLSARFERLGVVHSGLTESERSRVWHRAASGQATVILGTRSAVFAPCPNLGLICVDEEQEGGFKNLQSPRFHVRDVALMRAKQLTIPVVLGSATPSLETWYHSGVYPSFSRAIIRSRVKDLPLPTVRLVDMREEWARRGTATVISEVMETCLAETLARGEQGLVLINRRGYALRLYCPACRTGVTCPNCQVGLVVHAVTGAALCHYCRKQVPIPTQCPNVGCRGPLIQLGSGTQRVERFLADRFPDARIRRVDSDTMTRRAEYGRLVADVEAHRVDLLVGTQMIAKGLDFPAIAFVGMVDADPISQSTDFRSEERLFQMITQVAGRAGRADDRGSVVVQTTTPDLACVRYALSHDYESFAESELATRRRVCLPPYCRFARFVVSHPRDELARDGARDLADRICAAITAIDVADADVLGPGPCVLARLRGRYRHELILRSNRVVDQRRILDRLRVAGGFRVRQASVIVDVDPVSLT